jgi:hypothetical protein
MRSRGAHWVIGGALLAGILFASSTFSSPKPTSRFLVTEKHTKEECLNALDEVSKVGKKFLDQCDFGCMAGDHSAYVILEGKDEAEIQKMLPASWATAKIVRLNKFTPEQIAAFHKKM